jgi:hypothetical protein
VALAAFILLSPSARQVFGWRQEWLRPWVMFSGSGLEATEVRFVQITGDGTQVELDRYAILASDDPLVRERLRRVKDSATAKSMARSMCRKIGPTPEIRAYLREATREGWKVTMRGERNLCEGS